MGEINGRHVCRVHRCLRGVSADGTSCAIHAHLIQPCPTCTRWVRQKWDYCRTCNRLGWVTPDRAAWAYESDEVHSKPEWERGRVKIVEEDAEHYEDAGEDEDDGPTCPTCGESHGSRSCPMVLPPPLPVPASWTSQPWGEERQTSIMVVDVDRGIYAAMTAIVYEDGAMAVARLPSGPLRDTADGMRHREKDAERDIWWSKIKKRKEDKDQVVFKWV